MTKQELINILDEVVKMYYDYNCSVEEAVEWAKEVIKYDKKNNNLEKVN